MTSQINALGFYALTLLPLVSLFNRKPCFHSLIVSSLTLQFFQKLLSDCHYYHHYFESLRHSEYAACH